MTDEELIKEVKKWDDRLYNKFDTANLLGRLADRLETRSKVTDEIAKIALYAFLNRIMNKPNDSLLVDMKLALEAALNPKEEK